jgi:hypothetical protein
MCVLDKRLRDGDGTDRVVRVEGARMEQWIEILSTVVPKLVDRADDISNDGTKHGQPLRS